MAEVYWIRLPEHTDVFTQGYVGITSKTATERFKSHLKEAKRKDRKKYRIHNVLGKYKDSVILETLVICDDDYAIELEAALRPEARIGWNTVAGGQNVKLLRDIKETSLHSEEAKLKMKLVQKKSWSENRKTKLAKIVASRTSYDRPCDEYGNPTKFWESSRTNAAYWAFADKMFDFYKSIEICSSIELMDHFNVNRNKKQFFSRLLSYFDGGWNPRVDALWQEDFKQQEAVNGS
jgi:hypothetical protein